ncbi:hypothetical protein NDU88_000268 [Pleurodeles waltl]|uniref:Uncharacterized protein n=1 Tax=Pleurodeles waltl TaxID=8319 RepID=A0AAV7KLS4_PLEWA|nr:hypothetical protein NDU88_000268 [Pleurodeles waltl]
MPPSPHMSQRTVPMKDNSEHRVNQLRGQRPPEERYLACHRQGRPDPGGLPQTEHPLPEKMGGHSPLEQEDGGGSAGDGLPTWEGCLSHHDPLVFRILAVAYPELDGRLRASQQTQGGVYTLIQLALRALRGVWVGDVGCGFP